MPTHIEEFELIDALDDTLPKLGFRWKDHPHVQPTLHVYTWYGREPVPNRTSWHAVELAFPLKNGGDQHLRFVFYKFHARGEKFKEEDWRAFFDLRDVELPRIVPGIARHTTKHPADSTSDEDLALLAKLSLEPLPAQDQKRLNAYRKPKPFWFTWLQ